MILSNELKWLPHPGQCIGMDKQALVPLESNRVISIVTAAPQEDSFDLVTIDGEFEIGLYQNGWPVTSVGGMTFPQVAADEEQLNEILAHVQMFPWETPKRKARKAAVPV